MRAGALYCATSLPASSAVEVGQSSAKGFAKFSTVTEQANMKSQILVICALLVLAPFLSNSTAQPTPATTYYINSELGDDSATGTVVGGSAAANPWKTLSRASRQQFRNGDALLLHCGQTHRGHLLVRISQGEGQVRVGGYGTCTPEQMPKLDGSTSITLSASSERRSAVIPFEPGRVVVDGNVLARSFFVARFVQDAANPTAFSLVPAVPRNADLVNAQGYARTRDWLVEPVQFRNEAWTPVADRPNLQYPMGIGTMLAITGKPWALGRSAWVYDSANREFVISKAGEVAVSPRQPLIDVTGNGSVLIDRLHLVFAGEDAIRINISGTAAVRGSSITAPGRRGLSIERAASTFVVDNHIDGAGEDAIHVVSATRATVLRNLVTNTATLEPMQPAFAAINVSRAKSALVSQNTVQRSAYIGIRFGEGAEVSSNVVVDSCMRMSDCAAIYTWQRSPLEGRLPTKVIGNLVIGAQGNDEVKLGFQVWAVGIYLDDFTSNVAVFNNVVFGVRQGYYLHNAFQNSLYHNYSFGDIDASVSTQIDSAELNRFAVPNLGNVITDHYFVTQPKGDAMYIVRRAPLTTFKQMQLYNLEIAEEESNVSWFENIGSFEQPNFKRELNSGQAVAGVRKAIAKAPKLQLPKHNSWRLERVGNEIKVAYSAGHFTFVMNGGVVPDNCKELGKLETSALALLDKQTLLLHCRN